ncbi:MAG TPA: DUF4097 family beta strand repeat-containing protein [Lysobacter sp.]
MTRVHIQRLAFGLALLTTHAAFAATPINETRPLDPRGRVEIENVKGSVEVRAWDRPEVKIEGSLGEGVERLEIEGDRSHLNVRVKYPNRGGVNLFGSGDKAEPTDLRLMVPLRADLDIDVVSADVNVEGVASNELSIDAVSGDVTVAAAPREAEFDSVSGDLMLTINSHRVSAETVSGDLVLRGRLDGEVDVETVSGGIEVNTLRNRLQRLGGSSVSGDIRIDTGLATNGRVSLETVSGDITLSLPRDLSANVRGESFSGELSAPGAQIIRPKHGPGASFDHRFGSGDGDVTIETFSGDATLRLE